MRTVSILRGHLLPTASHAPNYFELYARIAGVDQLITRSRRSSNQPIRDRSEYKYKERTGFCFPATPAHQGIPLWSHGGHAAND
jgi:hypothetical protein